MKSWDQSGLRSTVRTRRALRYCRAAQRCGDVLGRRVRERRTLAWRRTRLPECSLVYRSRILHQKFVKNLHGSCETDDGGRLLCRRDMRLSKPSRGRRRSLSCRVAMTATDSKGRSSLDLNPPTLGPLEPTLGPLDVAFVLKQGGGECDHIAPYRGQLDFI